MEFDGIKKCISWKLDGIQYKDLAGAQDDLDALRKSTDDLHGRLILSIATFEEI